MNQKEKELFLELCAFRNPNAKKLDGLLNNGAATPEVLGTLFANRMAGVAYHVLKETELLDRVDREFRNSLRDTSLLYKKFNYDYLGCIKFLSTELEACGVHYALLKGAYLCHRYPEGCRVSNDIDVLIAPEDVGKVSVRLKMAGFKQGYLKNGVFIPATRQQIIESKMTRGETVPFVKEIKLPFVKFLEVDLNFSLDYKNSNDDTLKRMLSNTRLVSVESAKIRTLDKNDF
ncbi:MAG: nucleotidyltransferase family protein, partial [Paludibacteraceae bacterium]|nr:nucleotidyltransferase family protein [Paludibacteraceae bacterium]